MGLCALLLSTFLLSTGVVLGQVVGPGGRHDLQPQRRHPVEVLFKPRTIRLPIQFVVPDPHLPRVDWYGDIVEPKNTPVVVGRPGSGAGFRSGPIERPILSGPATGRSPDEMVLQGGRDHRWLGGRADR